MGGRDVILAILYLGATKEYVRYLGTTLNNQRRIHDEIKSRLNYGNEMLPFGLKYVVFPFAVSEYINVLKYTEKRLSTLFWT